MQIAIAMEYIFECTSKQRSVHGDGTISGSNEKKIVVTSHIKRTSLKPHNYNNYHNKCVVRLHDDKNAGSVLKCRNETH